MSDKGLQELLQELVAIPSVHPDSGDGPEVVGELRIAKYLAKYLEELEFKVEWDETTKGRPSVIGTFGPDDPGRTLLFEAHIDTVGIAGMVRPPFEAQVENGRMYGRGTCDDKGPMAAALWALRQDVLPALADSGCRVIFVGAMGEEKGNEGAERLVEQGLRADEAIILEPTDLNIIHAHKGALWFSIDVTGVAAHGSNPDIGLNAIYGMERVMAMLRQQAEEDAGRLQNPSVGLPTLSINTISGGEELNIVPATCSIKVDRRTVPEEDSRAIIDRVHIGLEELKREGCFLEYAVNVFKDAKPFHTRSDSGLVRRLSDSISATGIASKCETAAWYSDAGPFSGVCRETVVFGPGSIKQAHTSEEYIELGSLEAGCRVLSEFLKRTANRENLSD